MNLNEMMDVVLEASTPSVQQLANYSKWYYVVKTKKKDHFK